MAQSLRLPLLISSLAQFILISGNSLFSLSFGLTCSKRPQKPCTWKDGEKVRAGSQLGAQGLLGLSPSFGSQKVLVSGSGPLPMVFVGERVTLPFLEPQFPHLYD